MRDGHIQRVFFDGHREAQARDGRAGMCDEAGPLVLGLSILEEF